ncbi:MAG: thiolase family protein [Thermodesulfobacteriota bacterium]
MSRVYAIGAGMSMFGPFPETGVHDLGLQAAWEAIKNSGIQPRDLEVVFAGHAYQGPCFGQKILVKCGLVGQPVFNVENACASGASAVMGVYTMLSSGRYDLGLAIGGEKLTSPSGGFLPIVADDLDSNMGRVMPAAFAMIARRHMEEYGTTKEQMAKVAVKSKKNVALNPKVAEKYRQPVTLEEVLQSPVIADPLTRNSCCPVSDGAAALVLASERVVRKYTSRPVELVASVLASGKRTKHGLIDYRSEISIRAGQEAYEMAGLGPGDVDVCELHDPFTIAEIIHYEDLGFCGPGEGGRYIEEGRSEIGGRGVAVGPSGGLLGRGHPLGATGVAQLCELFWQLRGEAGPRQVPEAKVGLAHVVGGGVTNLESGACSVHVLKV